MRPCPDCCCPGTEAGGGVYCANSHCPRFRRQEWIVPPTAAVEPTASGDVAVVEGSGKTYDSPTFVRTGEAHTKAMRQTSAILEVMRDRRWRTIPELVLALHEADDSRPYIATSVSADLRNLRKARFGGYTVTRRRRDGVIGLHEYSLSEPKESDDE